MSTVGRFERLNRSHDRKAFNCGVRELDQYLQTQARQNQERGLAHCFVLAHEARILGYYTLSAGVVPLNHLPADIASKLRYADIPAALIGRLAVSQDHQGKGVGTDLLMNAFERVIGADLAALVVTVDPKDHSAASFYKKMGFLRLDDGGKRMFIPMQTIKSLVG